MFNTLDIIYNVLCRNIIQCTITSTQGFTHFCIQFFKVLHIDCVVKRFKSFNKWANLCYCSKIYHCNILLQSECTNAYEIKNTRTHLM